MQCWQPPSQINKCQVNLVDKAAFLGAMAPKRSTSPFFVQKYFDPRAFRSQKTTCTASVFFQFFFWFRKSNHKGAALTRTALKVRSTANPSSGAPARLLDLKLACNQLKEAVFEKRLGPEACQRSLLQCGHAFIPCSR